MDTSQYNATVIGKIQITPDIIILRVKTDEPRDTFESGQYTVLGLYGHEPRSVNSEEEFSPSNPEKLIRRAYSIASHREQTDQLEFYISQVKSGQLTPRLFHLNQGDRLFVGKKITGMFNLSDTPEDIDVAMVATGTGVAPYISFLRSHITHRPNTKMAVIHGATHQWDLGYYSELSFLADAFPNFVYLPTLTDADETWTGHRLWIQEMLEKDILQNEVGITMDPEKTHFFLCGNPAMIEHTGTWLTENRGYKKHSRKDPGNLHIEEF